MIKLCDFFKKKQSDLVKTALKNWNKLTSYWRRLDNFFRNSNRDCQQKTTFFLLGRL